MKKLLIYTALFFCVLVACKKDSPSPTPQAQNKLLGKWSYIQKGEAYPAGSQQVFTNQSGETDEFLATGEWIVIINGMTNTFHWQLLDPTTLHKAETGEDFKVVELTDTKLTLSRPNIKNGVQGEVFFYYTK